MGSMYFFPASEQATPGRGSCSILSMLLLLLFLLVTIVDVVDDGKWTYSEYVKSSYDRNEPLIFVVTSIVFCSQL